MCIRDRTHTNFEFIIVDDGSDDGCSEIISGYAKDDNRIKPIYRNRNFNLKSGAQARHAGIDIATGDYIAAMDSDDVALHNRLEEQLQYIKAEGLDACGGQAMAFGDSNGAIWFARSHSGIERELIFRVGILHPTMLIRAEFMRATRYNEDICHDDYEWQVRASGTGRLGNLDRVVLQHLSLIHI